MFDFERFIIAAKLAYRRCGSSAYSFGEVLQVFQYYDIYILGHINGVRAERAKRAGKKASHAV